MHSAPGTHVMITIEEHYPGRIFKHCPRCGAGGFALRDASSFRCERCDFVYFVNAAAAVAGLVFDDSRRLLLVERKNEPRKGMLDLPGGFADIMETAEEALRRELREELNIEITTATYLASFPNRYLYGGITYFTLDMGFICAATDFSRMRAHDDAAAIVFMRPDDIDLDAIGFESIRRMIALARQSPSSPTSAF